MAENSTDNNFAEKEKSFMAYFIRNHKVAYIVGLLIILWGALSTITIPKESAPNIPFGVVNITTVYNGASATDVDELVTQEIESKIKSVSGIKAIRSTSSIGVSNVSIEFQPDHNMIKGVSDIRSKLDEAKASLPDGIDQDPTVREISTEQQPFISIIIHGDADGTILRDWGEKLKREIERINDVAEVSISGGAEREIVVDINPILLHQYELTSTDISNSISSSHQNLPLGDIEIDNLDYTLRFEGRHQNVQDIKKVQIKNAVSNEASIITVEDVAKVYEKGDDNDVIRRFSTQEGHEEDDYVTLQVLKSTSTNIFNVTDKTKEVAETYAAKNFPENIKIRFIQEVAELTKESFGVVYNSGTSSVLIVLLLIFIFVGFKEGIVAGLVIPLTFVTTIGITSLMGNTLNFMTNFSMVLALGILVDTAIVIVEGCHDYIRKGNTPYQAAILALAEYKSPLISGTLTTLAVFIPLFTLPGVLGKYLSFIPITVSITLLSALAISLLLIPSYSSRFLKPHHADSEHTSWFARFAQEVRNKLNAGQRVSIQIYYRFVKYFIPKRWFRIGIIYLILILFLASWLIPVQFELFPQGDAPSFAVTIDDAIGTNSKKVSEKTKAVEELILDQEEVKLISTSINGNSASIYVELLPDKEREEKGLRESVDIVFALQNEFAKMKNANIRVQNQAQGPPSDSPVALRVVASDTENLDKAEAALEDIKNILKDIPGTFGVKDDVESTPGEVKYTIKRAEALARNVNPSIVALTLRTAIEGSTAATITKDQRDIDVVVKYQDNYTDDIKKIENIMVPSNTGKLIPLSEIVDYDIEAGLNSIQRVDTNIAFTVSSLLTEDGNAAEITAEFFERIKDYELPDGITIIDAGENEENAELFAALGSAFVIAMMIMFLILVVQFNSYLQPIIILSTIIFAMIGVNVGLYITSTLRSLAFILGVIALAGIVVNDAIILIDQINRKRAEKAEMLGAEQEDALSMFDSISRAGRSRFTPIILTTLTTAAGIAPLIWVDIFWAGLSYTVIFGLVVASFLTLVVTPAMYFQLEREKVITFIPLVVLGLIATGISSATKLDPMAVLYLGLAVLGIWWIRWSYKKTRV